MSASPATRAPLGTMQQVGVGVRVPIERSIHDGIAVIRRAGAAGAMPIVLLHGIGSNATSFEPLIDSLDEHCAILAWDAPGYGESRPLDAEWPQVQDYVLALEQLLDRLQIARAVFVGHSLGALIAARFAAAKPEQTAGVVLLSPAVGYGTVPGDPLPDGVRARVDELARLGSKAFAAARAPGLLYQPGLHPETTRRVEAAMAAVQMPGYRQAARMLASAQIFDDVAALQVPTVVACGAHDRVTPPAQTARVAAAVPVAMRVEPAVALIDGAGHALPQEQPRKVAELIATVIDRHVGSAHG